MNIHRDAHGRHDRGVLAGIVLLLGPVLMSGAGCQGDTDAAGAGLRVEVPGLPGIEIGGPREKVTICHATGSETNPYVEITVSAAAIPAHEAHQGREDIIPAPEGGCPGATPPEPPEPPECPTCEECEQKCDACEYGDEECAKKCAKCREECEVCPPPPPPEPEPVCGRMTGGGSILFFTSSGGRVTHGFTLHCSADAGPNRLQINWREGGQAYAFHLESLTSATCDDAPGIDEENPEAGFDTLIATGTGRLRAGRGPAESGYDITLVFTDAGEPGVNDTADLVISGPGGDVLTVSGPLVRGNHQAHREDCE